MKPLHLIAGKDELKPPFMKLVVKQGHVYVTDGNALIKIPTARVFGDVEFNEDEVLLFDAKQWAAAKMHTAKQITRDGLMFKNVAANTFIEATTPLLSGIHPLDYESVFIPKEWKSFPIPHIGLNPALLANVAAALGVMGDDLRSFALQFYGVDKGIELIHPDFADTYIMVMPTLPYEALDGMLKETTTVTLAGGETVEPVAAPAAATTNTKTAVTSSDFAAVRASLITCVEKLKAGIGEILDDHLSNTDELRHDLAESFDVILYEVREAEISLTSDELTEALMQHPYAEADHILVGVAETFGEIAIHEYLNYSRGYSIIKCDTQDQQTALRDFVQTSIYPLVSDSDKYSI